MVKLELLWKELSKLLEKKNIIDSQISQIIGRPAEKGHVGEYIAFQIFDIEPHNSATQKGSDGFFRNENLSSKRVNIKFYAKREGILDINTTNSPPDYYLVLTGPKGPTLSSRDSVRPWIIESVYLFDHQKLVEKLRMKGLGIGVATSVSKEHWFDAEVYPTNNNKSLILSEEQKKILALFS